MQKATPPMSSEETVQEMEKLLCDLEERPMSIIICASVLELVGWCLAMHQLDIVERFDSQLAELAERGHCISAELAANAIEKENHRLKVLCEDVLDIAEDYARLADPQDESFDPSEEPALELLFTRDTVEFMRMGIEHLIEKNLLTSDPVTGLHKAVWNAFESVIGPILWRCVVLGEYRIARSVEYTPEVRDRFWWRTKGADLSAKSQDALVYVAELIRERDDVRTWWMASRDAFIRRDGDQGLAVTPEFVKLVLSEDEQKAIGTLTQLLNVFPEAVEHLEMVAGVDS